MVQYQRCLFTLIERWIALHLTELGLVNRVFVSPSYGMQVERMLFFGCAINMLQEIDTSNQIFELGHTQHCHPFACFFSNKPEKVNDALYIAHKVICSQLVILRRNACSAIIEMADAQVLTAHGNHWRSAKTKALGAQNSRFDNIEAGFHTAVCLNANLATKPVATKRLMDLSKSELPGRASVPNRRQWAGSRTAVITRNGNQICVCFRNTGSDCANSGFRYEFYRDQGFGIDLFQIEYELSQIFDRVDIMMWWWRYQSDARDRIAEAGNQIVYLASRQLTTFSWLGTLRDFNLKHLGIDQVMRSNAKSPRGYLLNFGDTIGSVPCWIFTAFTTI